MPFQSFLAFSLNRNLILLLSLKQLRDFPQLQCGTPSSCLSVGLRGANIYGIHLILHLPSLFIVILPHSYIKLSMRQCLVYLYLLVWVASKPDPETGIWVQIVYL